jgi:hypothetical protein
MGGEVRTMVKQHPVSLALLVAVLLSMMVLVAVGGGNVAERRAAATAAYQRCVSSIVPTQRVSTHVAGVNDLAEILLANAIRNHNVTPRSSPQWETQLVNIRFLRMAVRKVAAVKSFPAPTKAECRDRRDEALSQAR